MACCKVRNKSRLSLAVERQFHALRGVACSRLFGLSPRAAGMVYRQFGVWLAAALCVPAMALLLALTT